MKITEAKKKVKTAYLPDREQPEEIEEVKKIAKSKGIGSDVLIREWILEKIHIS